MKWVVNLLFGIYIFTFQSVFAKDKLKVLLYSHIPTGSKEASFDSIKKRIKKEFEKENPSIELIVDMDNIKLDTYNVLNKHAREKGMISKNGYDLIEVDTLYIEKLVQKKLIQPIKLQNKVEYFNQAVESITVNGKEYGIPTFMCSYYLFHRTALKNVDVFGKNVSVSGMYSDSMVLSLMFYTIYSQIKENSENIFSYIEDEDTFTKLHEIISKCKSNKCITKDYFFSKDLAKSLTAENHTLSIGYSQMLHYLEKEKPGEYSLSKMTLSKKKTSTFSLTNALVLNKQRCLSVKCKTKAQLFFDYYSSLKTQQWMSLNLDNPSGIARYISPSIMKFYQSKRVVNNKTYQTIYENLMSSKAISGLRLLSTRKERTEKIINFLGAKDKSYFDMKKQDLWIQDFNL